jgi:hypothetical protein
VANIVANAAKVLILRLAVGRYGEKCRPDI